MAIDVVTNSLDPDAISLILSFSFRPLVKRSYQKNDFYFSTKTYVVGTQKHRLNNTVLFSTKTYARIMGKKIFTILR